MKTKIIYAIFAILVLSIIIYFILPQEPMIVENMSLEELSATSTKATSSSVKKIPVQKNTTIDNKDIYTINYTEKGFEPREIQIPRGTTLKFVNKSNKSMRVVADDEAKPPYSDLSQPKALGVNGEYQFNFVYAGIWKYYNLSKPEDVGNIVVY